MKRCECFAEYRGTGKRFFFSRYALAVKTRAAREGAWNEKDLFIGRRGDGKFCFGSNSRGGIARRQPFIQLDAAFFGAQLPLGPESQLFERTVAPLFGAADFFDAE